MTEALMANIGFVIACGQPLSASARRRRHTWRNPQRSSYFGIESRRHFTKVIATGAFFATAVISINIASQIAPYAATCRSRLCIGPSLNWQLLITTETSWPSWTYSMIAWINYHHVQTLPAATFKEFWSIRYSQRSSWPSSANHADRSLSSLRSSITALSCRLFSDGIWKSQQTFWFVNDSDRLRANVNRTTSAVSRCRVTNAWFHFTHHVIQPAVPNRVCGSSLRQLIGTSASHCHNQCLHFGHAMPWHCKQLIIGWCRLSLVLSKAIQSA